ncbi:hypothetical protein LY78DRAFT_337512 [Colletotrichum sublineola]|nr:hypothetical protein LY78DRAFT_337512 [Colletotrichum sublineola]
MKREGTKRLELFRDILRFIYPSFSASHHHHHHHHLHPTYQSAGHQAANPARSAISFAITWRQRRKTKQSQRK